MVRHSGAHACRLRIHVGDEEVRLEPTDDGRGSTDTVPGGGLTGLPQRLATVRGHLVSTSGGDGFTLAATVSLRSVEKDAAAKVAGQR